MNDTFHEFARYLADLTEILVNMHIIALLIINVTESPRRALGNVEGYTKLKKMYRLIEVLAGLVTPLAKR